MNPATIFLFLQEHYAYIHFMSCFYGAVIPSKIHRLKLCMSS